ncbi:hypothetical protein BDQ17DRAFT_1437465 [Cyathus striatus]|nr:hypothetical protein BDQ17DRAFT_1437465 [Cyathus striatus]
MTYSLSFRVFNQWLSADNGRRHLFSEPMDWRNFSTRGPGEQRAKTSTPADWTFGLRVLTFVLLEASFLVVAQLALRHPLLLLPSYLNLRTLKGGFTVISIIWHTLAIFTIQPLVTQVVSSEWYFVGSRTGVVRIGKDDTVSTLTADLVDHICHTLSRRASKTYRGAMLLSMILVGLGGLGPGTIGVSTLLVNVTSSMDIADLSHLKDVSSPLDTANTQFWMDRAERIIRTENIDGSTFGFVTQPNYVVPSPGQSFDLEQISQGIVSYRTDVVHFDYACEWQDPQADAITNQIYTTGSNPDNLTPAMFDKSGTRWILYPGNTWYNNIIIIQKDFLNETAGGVYQLFNDSTSQTAFFFLSGTNSTYTSMPPLIDLTGLPTVPTETIIPNGPIMAIAEAFPLCAMLVCDPSINLLGGTAIVGQDNTLNVVNTSETLTGNIPQSGADLMFSTALVTATTVIESGANSMSINAAISSLFFTDKMYYSLYDSSSMQSAEVLPLDAINQNMNTFMLSASKAYADGYKPIDENSPFEAKNGTGNDKTSVLRDDYIGIVRTYHFTVSFCGVED